MKVAYCILCHRNTNILQFLVEILGVNNDVYMHIDKKADINDFSEYAGVNFINDREDIRWGAFSMVKATLKLLEATCIKPYDYIFLISGDDLPLKSDEHIKNFLAKHHGKEFIGVTKDINVDERLKYIHAEGLYTKNKSLLNKLIYKLKLLKKNPYFNTLPKLYKGSQWFTITSDLRDYILQYVGKNEEYARAFEHSMISDEVFFQTIVCNNEKFKGRIYGINDNMHDTRMAMRYMDWTNGLKVLDEADYAEMKASGCLFAREMSENIDVRIFKRVFYL